MSESEYDAHLHLPMVQHINYQPELVAGLNFSEVLMAAAVACVIGMPSGTAIAFAIGKPIFSLGFGFGAAMLCGFMSTKIMKYLKRQRPDGYYVQWLMRHFEPLIPGVTFIRTKGHYDRYRHNESP